jgi:hypothetical protein
MAERRLSGFSPIGGVPHHDACSRGRGEFESAGSDSLPDITPNLFAIPAPVEVAGWIQIVAASFANNANGVLRTVPICAKS